MIDTRNTCRVLSEGASQGVCPNPGVRGAPHAPPRPARVPHTRMAPCPIGTRGHRRLWHTKADKDTSRQEVPSSRGSGRGVFWPRVAWVWAWVTLTLVAAPAHAKYVEGFLKTSEVGTAPRLSLPCPCLTLCGRRPSCLSAPPSTNPPLPLQRWAFLARFCFLSHDGTFSFEVEYDMRFATQRLLLYYDAPNQWPAVYGSTKVGAHERDLCSCKTYDYASFNTRYLVRISVFDSRPTTSPSLFLGRPARNARPPSFKTITSGST